MYSSEEIKDRMRQKPFVPVRFVVSSGEKYEVRHPDMVMVGERDIQVGNPSSKDPSVYSGVSRLALIHITAMEDLPVTVPSTAAGNGSAN